MFRRLLSLAAASRAARAAVLAAALAGSWPAFVACAHTGPAAGAAEEDGGRLYAHRCGGCHAPFDPEGRTRSEWRRSMRVMAREAHLTRSEEQAILAWLDARAKDSDQRTMRAR